MNNNKKTKICEFIINITGILFWYNVLMILFGSGISKDRILIISLSLVIGYMGFKAKDYLVSKN